jgi:hypothetical protein
VVFEFPVSSSARFFWRSKRNEHYYKKRGCHFETPDITEDNRGLLITPSVIREPLVPVLQTENKQCASLSAFCFLYNIFEDYEGFAHHAKRDSRTPCSRSANRKQTLRFA